MQFHSIANKNGHGTGSVIIKMNSINDGNIVTDDHIHEAEVRDES